MSSPLFSIVIPTYNRAAFIIQTIESVLRQDFADFELLVVDDGSTDLTEAAVRGITDPRVRYLKKINEERGAARNFGTRNSKGYYINFLDSDDLLYQQHLSVADAFVREHQQPEVFHLGFDVKNERGDILRTSNNIRDINLQILRGNILSCNGVFMRRDIAIANPFIESRSLSSLEDWELWIRLASRYRFLHSREVTSSVIHHDDRSVMARDHSRIKEKVERFVDCVSIDETNQKVYGHELKKAFASGYTYAALHLAIAGAPRAEVIRYLKRGLLEYPGEILTRRFAVIMKYLIIPAK